nr:TolC family protein [Deltaproteobacteria bacterium]
GARIDAAKAGLSADQAQLDAIRNQVTADVREQFAKALAAGQRLQIADDALVIARQGVVAAEERLRAGAAPVLEVNSARVEIGRATRERAVADGARTLALANLRLLIALDPGVELSLQGDLTQATAVVTEPVAALLEEALANRAEVRQNRLASGAAQAEARLASREWIPTPKIGISYAREGESDTTIIQGILAFDLPIFNRNVAARGVTAARVRQLRVAQDEAERRIKQQTLTAIARVRAAEASTKGYGADVVKAMTDNMDLVTESYRVGKIDFLQLIVIRRQAVDARRDYIDVLEELSSARAELDLALGRSSATR